MRKPVIVFLVLLLAETISGMVLVYASSASNLFVPPQAASSEQSVVIAKSSLPSPFTVAAWIVGLVAVFGALLSLLLRGRHSSQAEEKRIGERFWAIDSYWLMLVLLLAVKNGATLLLFALFEVAELGCGLV